MPSIPERVRRLVGPQRSSSRCFTPTDCWLTFLHFIAVFLLDLVIRFYRQNVEQLLPDFHMGRLCALILFLGASTFLGVGLSDGAFAFIVLKQAYSWVTA